MFFWIKKNKEKAIPALYKTDVDENHIKNKYTLQSEKTFCRHSLCGSMTVEAAIVIPIVFFVWIACVAWTAIVNVHDSVQHLLMNTAMELSVAAGTDIETVENMGVMSAWGQIMQLEDLEKGGIEQVYGFDFSQSRVLRDDQTILLKVNYRVRILEGVIPIPSIKLSNQVYTRAWTGADPEEQEILRFTEDDGRVYLSEYGRVYHTNRMCSHIHLTIYMVGERQTQGYAPCDKCMDDNAASGQTFYITKTGEHYHSRLGCSGLKRQVDSIGMTEAMTMGYQPCSRCGGEEG